MDKAGKPSIFTQAPFGLDLASYNNYIVLNIGGEMEIKKFNKKRINDKNETVYNTYDRIKHFNPDLNLNYNS